MLDAHGEVMSQVEGQRGLSREEMIAGYGADAVRAYILFLGPPDEGEAVERGRPGRACTSS